MVSDALMKNPINNSPRRNRHACHPGGFGKLPIFVNVDKVNLHYGTKCIGAKGSYVPDCTLFPTILNYVSVVLTQ